HNCNETTKLPPFPTRRSSDLPQTTQNTQKKSASFCVFCGQQHLTPAHQVARRRRTTKLTDRHDLTYENQKLQGKSPGANGGSVQRVEHTSELLYGFVLIKSLP